MSRGRPWCAGSQPPSARADSLGDVSDIHRRTVRSRGPGAKTAIDVGPVSTRIAAPPQLVYQMLAAVGSGNGNNGERALVLERSDDELVCDFWTRVSLPGGVDRLVRTRERVTLRPPDIVQYEHLDGPLRGLRETITVAAHPGGGTEMIYAGSYVPGGILDQLRVRLLARPVIGRVIRQHFDDVRARAEARAARSRVFPAPGSVSRSTSPRPTRAGRR